MSPRKPRIARICAKCGEHKGSDLFEGTRSTCRACRSKEQVERVKKRRVSDAPRRCARCKETKPSHEFASKSWCRPCSTQYYREHEEKKRVADPARVEQQRRYQRERYLLRTYGITIEQYEEMLVAQGGTCAICPATRGASDRESLCVDHNHTTGEPRALLCVRCNLSVRDLGDDLEFAERVLAYVRKHAA